MACAWLAGSAVSTVDCALQNCAVRCCLDGCNAKLYTMCDMNGPHAGRVVLITGAGGGVGRGYALL